MSNLGTRILPTYGIADDLLKGDYPAEVTAHQARPVRSHAAQSGLPILFGQPRGGFPVVGHCVMLDLPAIARPGDDGVPCVRTAGFHGLRVRGFFRIGRKSHTSGIDEQHAIRHLNCALQMAVSAEHKPGSNSVQNGRKLLRALHTRAAGRDLFEQIDIVGPGSAVAEQDVAKQQGLRHRGQPLFVRCGQGFRGSQRECCPG